MGKLKVLMLGWEFPPIINGGLGVACLGIANALAKKVQLTLILPKSDAKKVYSNMSLIGLNNLSEEEITETVTQSKYIESIKIKHIEANINPYASSAALTQTETQILEAKEQITKAKPSGLALFKQEELYGDDLISRVLAYANYAANLADDMDFDVIHAHDWMTFLAGLEIKKRSKKPLVLHVHALDYDRGGASSRGWIFDVEKQAMLQADLIIPVSQYTGNVIVNHYGIGEEKIKPVHNGVDPVEAKKVAKGFKEKMVLFLGRLTAQKGPEFFLDIADKVISKNSNVRFVVAGTGDQLKKLIETGAYRNVGHKFHFTGFLDQEKVAQVLGMADVYCMPSVSEPFGLSALEATQYGIPAVISKQSGVAEVLKGALKADYWDVDVMAKHILDLIDQEALREKVVEAGYKDLTKLTWDNTAKKIIAHYKELLD